MSDCVFIEIVLQEEKEYQGKEGGDKVYLRFVGFEVLIGNVSGDGSVGGYMSLEFRNEILVEVRGLIVIILNCI